MSGDEAFGHLLRRLRKGRDLTQERLAQQVYSATDTIKKLEQGLRRPSRQLAAQLADGLGLAGDERAAFLAAARATIQPGGNTSGGTAASVDALTPAAPRLQNNLPAQPNTFIGREREVAVVRNILRRPGVRLLTLTGPGGTGKTRLALQVASDLLDEFAHGVWFVNLAPIGDPALVIPTIAQALGLKERGGESLEASLKAYLREKQLLLLLDNFEQLVDAAVHVAELLAAAPNLKLLITSRAVLYLSGEHEFVVPPLALPERQSITDVAHLTQYEAVRLFIERAQAVKHDFVVTNQTAPAVAEICHRLDGLPLAIELAAVRVKLFAPDALLARLSSRLTFLTSGPRDLPARQQTIRATIDWSYQLLDAAEQALFRRLGVFAGGCTLEAATVVAANDDQTDAVLDGLSSLVDKSLLKQIEGANGAPRFMMLETIREYALERLMENGEANALRQRHATYCLELAEEAEPQIRYIRPERAPWLERLAAEHDNLRAALAWFGERGNTERRLRLAGALRSFWANRYHWTEGRAWLESALAPSDTMAGAARARALVAAAQIAFNLDDIPTAHTYIEEGLALLRELGDKAAIANALFLLGNVMLATGAPTVARECAEESLALFEAVNEPWGRPFAVHLLGRIAHVQGDVVQAAVHTEEVLRYYRQIDYKLGIGIALCYKGIVAQLQGDWDQAVALYTESLALVEEQDAKYQRAIVLHNLASAVLHQGDARRAAACFAEGLTLSRELGTRELMAAHLAGMAGVIAAERQPEQSAQLFGAAEALFDALGIVVEPQERAEYDRNRDIARAQLSEEAFAAAWAVGRALDWEQAVDEALAFADAVEGSAR